MLHPEPNRSLGIILFVNILSLIHSAGSQHSLPPYVQMHCMGLMQSGNSLQEPLFLRRECVTQRLWIKVMFCHSALARTRTLTSEQHSVSWDTLQRQWSTQHWAQQLWNGAKRDTQASLGLLSFPHKCYSFVWFARKYIIHKILD